MILEESRGQVLGNLLGYPAQEWDTDKCDNLFALPGTGPGADRALSLRLMGLLAGDFGFMPKCGYSKLRIEKAAADMAMKVLAASDAQRSQSPMDLTQQLGEAFKNTSLCAMLSDDQKTILHVGLATVVVSLVPSNEYIHKVLKGQCVLDEEDHEIEFVRCSAVSGVVSLTFQCVPIGAFKNQFVLTDRDTKLWVSFMSSIRHSVVFISCRVAGATQCPLCWHLRRHRFTPRNSRPAARLCTASVPCGS
jgi:hypothetical protein